MSHWSIIRIKIANPNRAILSEALKMVAGELKCNVQFTGDQAYLFIDGRRVSVDLNNATIKFRDYERNIAVKVEQLLSQYYTAISFNVALQSLGYVVQIQKAGDRVVIRGIK